MNRRRFVVGVSVLVCALSGASPAGATVGGPEVTRLLGFDVRDQKVYFVVYDKSEAGDLPRVYYVDCSPNGSHTPVAVRSWYAKASVQHRGIEARIARLKSRLRTIASEVPEDFDLAVIKVAESAGVFSGVDRPVYELKLTVRAEGYSGSANVKAYCNNDVRLAEWFRVPDTEYAVATLTYTGIPFETCYTKEVLVVLDRGTSDASQAEIRSPN